MESEKGNSRHQKRLQEIVGVLLKHNILSGISPEKLVLILQDLGPTFIKLGQLISMQPTLPAAYCRELAKLRTHVVPMEFEEVKSILESEYGENWQDIFTWVDPAPLGSASIAQVHPAALADGDSVVLKIQRRGIYEIMSSDIILLRRAAAIVKYTPIGHTINFEMVIDEMWVVTKQEMDFLVEAENAREFYKNNEDVAYVDCPEIYGSYSTAKVLVMENIQGIYIDDVDALDQNGYDREEIALKLANNYIKQVVDDGFFHGDPHAGNLIIRDGKIVWIDLGMVGHLSSHDRKLFAEAIAAVTNYDTPGLTDAVLSIGQYKGHIDRVALTDDLEAMLLRFSTADFGSLDLGEFLEDFISILTAHGIQVPRGMSMLGRSMATIQGTLRTVCADINLTEVLAGYMSSDYLRNFDVKKEITDTLRSMNVSFKKSLDIPARLADALRLLSKGSAKMNTEMTMSEEMSQRLDRMLNRLVVAIVAAALLIGSSLVSTTNMYPQVLGIPMLGFIGFLVALVLGGWLLISMLRFRKKK